MDSMSFNEIVTKQETHLGQQGLMVHCSDVALASQTAQEVAAQLGKSLQDTTPQSLARNNKRLYFFPYQP